MIASFKTINFPQWTTQTIVEFDYFSFLEFEIFSNIYIQNYNFSVIPHSTLYLIATFILIHALFTVVFITFKYIIIYKFIIIIKSLQIFGHNMAQLYLFFAIT